MVGLPSANEGHRGEGALAVVRVSPEARSSYEHLTQDSELPDGTVVALFHRESAEGPAGAVYVMQKTGKIWQFLRLAPDGSLLGPASSPQNSAKMCAACHAEGVADALFGVPRSVPGRP